mmetsp:Transcript_12131/g.22888  ORF Transcript_12131/g.22888 Transcript_12131/m.22888 type:complete len:104 (+) Transcript_12131:150-461(+)
MNVNTYLLEVRLGGWAPGPGWGIKGVAFGSKPDMKQRVDGFVTWFEELSGDDVPDVVVFNEIFSKAGSSILKRLCNPNWNRGGRAAKNGQVFTCSGKKFQVGW